MPLYPFEGIEPQVADTVFVAPTATVIGDVVVGADASIWFGAVLRGDFGRIEVGEGTCVQDNAVLHCTGELPTRIGRNVTIGHGATLEGCAVEDGAVIGTGSVVLQRAHIGAGSMVAAGSVVGEGQAIPAGVLAAGLPARVKKELDGSARRWVENAAFEYRRLRDRYLQEVTTNPW
jgi:carbonic anhydrase/acetyltransferase-like protein (isoleucine patch superfamily)